MISSSQRPLPDNTQHSQYANFHASGGIRTHDLSRRAAADLCLRLRGHWDWQNTPTYNTQIAIQIVTLPTVTLRFWLETPCGWMKSCGLQAVLAQGFRCNVGITNRTLFRSLLRTELSLQESFRARLQIRRKILIRHQPRLSLRLRKGP